MSIRESRCEGRQFYCRRVVIRRVVRDSRRASEVRISSQDSSRLHAPVIAGFSSSGSEAEARCVDNSVECAESWAETRTCLCKMEKPYTSQTTGVSARPEISPVAWFIQGAF